MSCLCGLSAAQAADALALQPTGPWTVDYADESCALLRPFGDGKDQARLELRQYEPDGLMTVTIASSLASREGDFRYAFMPDPMLRSMGPPAQGTSASDRSVIRFTTASLRSVEATNEFYLERNRADGRKDVERLPIWRIADRESRFGAITGLSVEDALSRDIILHTGLMAAPMRAMDKCFAQLIEEWGLDPAVQSKLSRHAAVRDVIKDDTWSVLDSVMKVSKSSSTRMRMMIDAAGNLSSCQVLGAAKATRQADALCQTFADSGRFEPALDENGQAIPSYLLIDVSIGVARL